MAAGGVQMAQKMLIFLLVAVLGWLVLDWMKGPDLVIYLQSPTEIGDGWSFLMENPGPKTAENVEFTWIETYDNGSVFRYSRHIGSFAPEETFFQGTQLQRGTIEVELKCCGNFKLYDAVRVIGESEPPYPILNYNFFIHPIYSAFRFAGVFRPSLD